MLVCMRMTASENARDCGCVGVSHCVCECMYVRDQFSVSEARQMSTIASRQQY